MDSNQMPTAAGERFTTATIERRRDARHDFGQLAITSNLSQEPLFIAEQFLPFPLPREQIVDLFYLNCLNTLHSNSLLSAPIKTLCKDLIDSHLF